MRVAIDVAGTEDKAPAELEGVLAGAVLPVAGGAGALASRRVIAAEHMQQGGGSQTRRAICLPLLVHEERKGDAGVLAEQPRVAPAAESDSRKARALFPECLLVLAQLRDVLAAKHSAVVTQKD